MTQGITNTNYIKVNCTEFLFIELSFPNFHRDSVSWKRPLNLNTSIDSLKAIQPILHIS